MIDNAITVLTDLAQNQTIDQELSDFIINSLVTPKIVGTPEQIAEIAKGNASIESIQASLTKEEMQKIVEQSNRMQYQSSSIVFACDSDIEDKFLKSLIGYRYSDSERIFDFWDETSRKTKPIKIELTETVYSAEVIIFGQAPEVRAAKSVKRVVKCEFFQKSPDSSILATISLSDDEL